MLTLIGLGLHSEKDLTLRGIEAAKAADKAYIELYTSRWEGLKALEKIIGKSVVELKREDLEQRSQKILDEAKKKKIILFVPGDPLIATVHTALVEQAKKRGIKTKIIHNASIISAVGETGLHIYRFGASATVPFPEKTKGKLPESVYEVIKLNKKAGLHTLLLLDVIAEKNKLMSMHEALNILLVIEAKRMEGVLSNDSLIIGVSRLGSPTQIVKFGRLKDFFKIDFGSPPHCIIIPGLLHFTEKEFLEKFM